MRKQLYIYTLNGKEKILSKIDNLVERAGYDSHIIAITNPLEAFEPRPKQKGDLILVFDEKKSDKLNYISDTFPNLPIICILDEITESKALELVNSGVYDYLEKSELHKILPVAVRAIRDSKTLKKQRKIAERLALENKYKSDFLANISHEIRTTLDSIILFSKLLSQNSGNNLSEKEFEYSNAILNLGSGIHELINEVLDHSSIESGKMDIQLNELSVESFCKKIELMYRPLANEENLEFQARVLSDNVPTLTTDPIRVEQVIKNLLSNAFKFTDEGSISVEVYVPSKLEIESAPLEQPDIVAFRVTDTGIGIPRERQTHIFESFRQADDTIHRKYGGTGLGLTISREITHILGGKLTLNSEAGKGTVFTLYLPLDSTSSVQNFAQKGRITLITSERKGPTPEKRRQDIEPKEKTEVIDGTVLLVDDSEIHNRALSEFLSYKIRNCLSVTTAKETYQIIDQEPVDCIILDMHLVDAGGYEVISHIREQDQYRDLPIIIYTGKNMNKDELQKMQNYADAVISKNVGSYKILQKKVIGLITGQDAA